MTATPFRTSRTLRPAQTAGPARTLIVRPVADDRPAEPLPSARQTGLGVLLGLFGVLVAFAALPIALSTPALGVVLLVLGVALLAMQLRRDPAAALDGTPPVSDGADPHR